MLALVLWRVRQFISSTHPPLLYVRVYVARENPRAVAAASWVQGAGPCCTAVWELTRSPWPPPMWHFSQPSREGHYTVRGQVGGENGACWFWPRILIFSTPGRAAILPVPSGAFVAPLEGSIDTPVLTVTSSLLLPSNFEVFSLGHTEQLRSQTYFFTVFLKCPKAQTQPWKSPRSRASGLILEGQR